MDADRQQGEVASSNPEIDIIRAELIASPRPSGFPERRASLDALGSHYEMPAGVRVEPVSANAVSAEWTVPPQSDHFPLLIFLPPPADDPPGKRGSADPEALARRACWCVSQRRRSGQSAGVADRRSAGGAAAFANPGRVGRDSPR